MQSHSWETNRFAASQETPRISRNPKVHYRTHKRPPPVSILGQPNPVHIPTSHLLEVHHYNFHPSTPRSTPVVFFPPVSPAGPYTHPSPHPYAPHAQPISFFSILSPAQYDFSKYRDKLTRTHGTTFKIFIALLFVSFNLRAVNFFFPKNVIFFHFLIN